MTCIMRRIIVRECRPPAGGAPRERPDEIRNRIGTIMFMFMFMFMYFEYMHMYMCMYMFL